ncbi:unnamed protein product [Allacma fusca]|uniref:Uncharacterized protein n=1 Tax=Allacma fusca TaxID=39272 RepID=A0A8J2K235_9HEXA|nr:unnamed protein product [Allacma fusca]
MPAGPFEKRALTRRHNDYCCYYWISTFLFQIKSKIVNHGPEGKYLQKKNRSNKAYNRVTFVGIETSVQVIIKQGTI